VQSCVPISIFSMSQAGLVDVNETLDSNQNTYLDPPCDDNTLNNEPESFDPATVLTKLPNVGRKRKNPCSGGHFVARSGVTLRESGSVRTDQGVDECNSEPSSLHAESSVEILSSRNTSPSFGALSSASSSPVACPKKPRPIPFISDRSRTIVSSDFDVAAVVSPVDSPANSSIASPVVSLSPVRTSVPSSRALRDTQLLVHTEPLVQKCLLCKSTSFSDLWEHVRGCHSPFTGSLDLLEEMGFFCCDCGTPVKSFVGWKRHKSVSKCSANSCCGKDLRPKKSVVAPPKRTSHPPLPRVQPVPLPRAPQRRNSSVLLAPLPSAVSMGDSDPKESVLDEEDVKDEADGLNMVEELLDQVRPPVDSSVYPDITKLSTDQEILDAFVSLSRLHAPSRILPKSVVKPFLQKVDDLCKKYLNDASCLNLFHLMAFPTIVFARSMTNGKAKCMVNRIRDYPNVETLLSQVTSAPSDKRRYVNKCLENGRLGAAFSALLSEKGEMPARDVLIQQLQDLHPSGNTNPFPAAGNRGYTFAAKDMALILKSLKLDTAPGPSGWSAYLAKLCSGVPTFLEFLATLASQVANNTAPGHALLTASRLVAIPKPDGKIRPIAVGEIFYRVIAKAILSHLRSDNDLAPFQFGVGSAGGCEVLLHHLQNVVAPGGNFALVSIDISNAFNSLPRNVIASGLQDYNPGMYRAAKWIYNQPSKLVISLSNHVDVIESSCGVRQGDPLGPYLFSIGFRKKLEALDSLVSSKGGKLMAYLDDCVLLLPCEDACPSDSWKKEILGEVEACLGGFNGLKINASKSQFMGFENAWRSGFKVFGSMIGNGEVQATFLQNKVNELDLVLSKLQSLPLQQAQLLFRHCYVNRLNYLARVVNPNAASQIWMQVDEKTRMFFSKLAGMALEEKAEMLIHLPTKMGGVGIPQFTRVSQAAFQAASLVTDAFWSYLLRVNKVPSSSDIVSKKQKEIMKETSTLYNQHFLDSLSPLELVALSDNASVIGRSFWRILPLNPAFVIHDLAFARTLRYRLLLSDPPTCPRCNTQNNFVHVDGCRSTLERMNKTKHDKLVLAVKSAIMDTTTKVTTEVHAQNSNLRVDLMINGPRSFKGPCCVGDVTVVSLHSKDSQEAIDRCPRTEGEEALTYGARLGQLLIDLRAKFKEDKYRTVFPQPLAAIVFLPSGSLSHEMGRWLRSPGFYFEAAAILTNARSL
jgi:hypothetical protein